MHAHTITPKTTDDLVPTAIVHQTAYWSRVQRRLGVTTDAFDVAYRPAAVVDPSEEARGDVLVVRSPLSDDVECAYVPFGPEISPDAEDVGSFLEGLSRELRPLLGPRCAFIRWDLPWTSIHAREPADFTRDGEWHGPPAKHLREIRMNFGTRDHNLWKAPRDLMPPDTVLIDLHGSEDVILERMHHKTRYNIRLARRRGVVVEQGTTADLPAWYALYLETAARNQLVPMSMDHFRAMLDDRAEGSASPVQTRLLLARFHGQLLAGMLLAIALSRATYMYGASTRANRDLMASSALQWAAIQLAKAGAVPTTICSAARRAVGQLTRSRECIGSRSASEVVSSIAKVAGTFRSTTRRTRRGEAGKKHRSSSERRDTPLRSVTTG